MSRFPVEIVDVEDHQRVVIRSINGRERIVLSAELSSLLRVRAAVEIAKAAGNPKLLLDALAEGITGEAAQFLVDCIIGKRRGHPPVISMAERWVERVNEIKAALRVRGVRKRIHEIALEIFEIEYALVRQRSAKFGSSFYLPPFDRQRFENRNRRSKRPRRSHKSRAK